MCRKHIDFPWQLRQWESDMDITGMEGLAVSLHISSAVAQEIYNILKMSPRRLFATETPMPFLWDSDAMISDLPKVMIVVARRFPYQSKRKPVPANLSGMKLYNPMSRVAHQSRTYKLDLESLPHGEAPIAQHPDAHELNKLLRERIDDLERLMGDQSGICKDWEGPAEMLFGLVKEQMPKANEGVQEKKWWAYVWCVIKGVMVWQAYCERVKKLSGRQMTQVSVDEVRAA
jgi:hypothetical protein